MRTDSVVVAIPTYRRPKGLKRLLRALEGQAARGEIRVVVADNDGDLAQGRDVCDNLRAQGYGFPLSCRIVPERGIANTRNALIAAALEEPAADLVVMIDDDEWPGPGWLAALIEAQARFDADIVGGPVVRHFEAAVPDYVARANAGRVGRTPTGPVDFVDATSNILFRAAVFRYDPGLRFDGRYALMGGEDKDLLVRLRLSGRRFAWAEEAVVNEAMAPSRCSARWALKRAFWVGNTDTLINMRRGPPGFTVAREVLKIVGALTVSASTLVVMGWHPSRRFEALRLGARVMGKLTALAGLRYQEYAVTHGA